MIEDLDRDAEAGGLDERALFHLINMAREEGFHILFTGVRAPGQIEIALAGSSLALAGAAGGDGLRHRMKCCCGPC